MQMLNFKKNLLMVVMVAFTSLTIVSCSKKDDDATNEGSFHLSAKIGSKDRTFSDARARWVDGGNYLEITGRVSSNASLTITVLNQTTRVPLGKYTLDDSTPFSLLSIYNLTENNAQKNYTASRGTVWSDAFNLEITKIDNTVVEGKFTGTLVIGSGLNTLETITVENGSFSAPFK